jgi:hypothetical protein
MKLQSHVVRFCLVIIAVCAVECLWVWFAPRPFPIAAIIPATIPIWVVVFVIIPMQKKAKA